MKLPPKRRNDVAGTFAYLHGVMTAHARRYLDEMRDHAASGATPDSLRCRDAARTFAKWAREDYASAQEILKLRRS